MKIQRKGVHSKEYTKAKLKVQRLHHKIDNIRTDYINKSIAEIVKPSHLI